MNIIEAFQHAESGKLIRNGILKRLDHFLKYMDRGVFYEYELSDGKTIYKYERHNFSMQDIMSNDWEILDSNLMPKGEIKK